MALTAQGVKKAVAYIVQSAFGTGETSGTAQLLRFESFGFDLKKETYSEQEVTTHMMENDVRHGVKEAPGKLAGKLSPGTYKDFFACLCGRAFAAVSSITGASITIASSGSGVYTLTRAAGSYLTDGIKVGMTVRLTAGSFTAGNLNNNLLVIAVTALVCTVVVVNSSALTAEGPIASATLAIPGKVTYIVNTGQSDLMYTFEEWDSVLSLGKYVDSVKARSLAVKVPATGMVDFSMDLIGRMLVRGTAQVLTSPTAQTTTGIVASVNGRVVLNGAVVALITEINYTVKRDHQGEAAAGSDYKTEATPDRFMVDGTITVLFQSNAVAALFDNETEVTLAFALSTGTTGTADVISQSFPRSKLLGADEQWNRRNLKLSCPFKSLYYSSGGSGVQHQATAYQVQDTQA